MAIRMPRGRSFLILDEELAAAAGAEVHADGRVQVFRLTATDKLVWARVRRHESEKRAASVGDRAWRIGVHDETAKKSARKLIRIGLLKLVKPGQMASRGHRGRATELRTVFPDEVPGLRLIGRPPRGQRRRNAGAGADNLLAGRRGNAGASADEAPAHEREIEKMRRAGPGCNGPGRPPTDDDGVPEPVRALRQEIDAGGFTHARNRTTNARGPIQFRNGGVFVEVSPGRHMRLNPSDRGDWELLPPEPAPTAEAAGDDPEPGGELAP